MTKIKIKNWLAKKNNIGMELKGVVKAESKKAILFKGTAVTKETTHCLRCGRELTHSGSKLVGYGPICCQKIGIYWPDKKELTDEEIEKVKNEIKKVTFEGWLPKSQLEILEGTLTPKKKQENKNNSKIIIGEHKEVKSFIITFDYNPKLVTFVKCNVPNRRWYGKEKYWHTPVTPGTALEINKKLDKFKKYSFEIDESVKKVSKQYIDMKEKSKKQKSAELNIKGLNPELQLRPFQNAGVRYALKKEKTFIADDQGLGKTIEAIATIQKKKAYPALIVVPAAVKINWKREFEKWVPGINVEVMEGRSNDELKDVEVTVINYDILSYNADLLKTRKYNSVVFDESHYLKNHKAKRTKTAKDLVKELNIPVRLLLTGTPINNRPKELIPQLELINKLDEMGGFWNFAKRYCNAHRGQFGLEMNGAANLTELNNSLRAVGFIRREKQEVLKELPDKQKSTIEIDISNKTEYKKAERNVNSWIKDNTSQKDINSLLNFGSPTADQLTRLTVLRKLAGKGKIKAAKNWINDFLETENKLVVFAHHREVIEKLAKEFNANIIIGGQKEKERQQAIDDFQNNPDTKIIVCSIKAAGVGITLTAASDVLFVEQVWTSTAHEQAEDRCHRIGQKNSVNCYYLVDNTTIDKYLRGVIEEKAEIFTKITETI